MFCVCFMCADMVRLSPCAPHSMNSWEEPNNTRLLILYAAERHLYFFFAGGPLHSGSLLHLSYFIDLLEDMSWRSVLVVVHCSLKFSALACLLCKATPYAKESTSKFGPPFLGPRPQTSWRVGQKLGDDRLFGNAHHLRGAR